MVLAYGSRPMPLTFHIPNASSSPFVAMNVNFTNSIWSLFPSVSNGANVRWMFKIEVMGVLNSIKTIIIEKIWRLLPVMYIPGPKLEIFHATSFIKLQHTYCIHR